LLHPLEAVQRMPPSTKAGHALFAAPHTERLLLFTGMSGRAVQMVLRRGQVHEFAPTEAMSLGAHTSGHFGLVLDGYLTLKRCGPAGKSIALSFFGPGTFLDLATEQEFLVASTPSVLVSWDQDAWESLGRRHANLVQNALHLLRARLRDAREQVHEITTQDVERRLARLLLRICSDLTASGDIATTGHPVSRKDLADLVGTTEHTVSRMIRAWHVGGIVDAGRRRVAITNLAALNERARS